MLQKLEILVNVLYYCNNLKCSIKRGSTAQNLTARILTAQHLKKKMSSARPKMSTAQKKYSKCVLQFVFEQLIKSAVFLSR
jgi:hypothetical protein